MVFYQYDTDTTPVTRYGNTENTSTSFFDFGSHATPYQFFSLTGGAWDAGDYQVISYSAAGACDGLTRSECLSLSVYNHGCFSYPGGVYQTISLLTCNAPAISSPAATSTTATSTGSDTFGTVFMNSLVLFVVVLLMVFVIFYKA